MDLLTAVLLIVWFLLELSKVFWGGFLILAVVVGFFSPKVKSAFADFVILVFKTAWNGGHIHWFKRNPVEETEVVGHLAVIKSKRCRCGYFKKHIEVL